MHINRIIIIIIDFIVVTIYTLTFSRTDRAWSLSPSLFLRFNAKAYCTWTGAFKALRIRDKK